MNNRYATFISTCEQLDTELVQLLQTPTRRRNLPEATIQLFMKMMKSTHVNFLSGARKEKAVKSRKVSFYSSK